MKKSLLIGAAAILAMAAPGVASAEMNGHVGAAWGWLDDDDSSDKDGVWAFDGAFSTPVHNNWVFQFDGSMIDMDHGDHGHSFGNTQAHMFMRSDTHAFGGFVAAANIDGDPFFGLGLEGAAYFNRFTWSGQIGGMWEHDTDNDQIFNVSTRGDFFINDNFSIGAELGWTDSEWESEEAVVGGINGEYQFNNSPFSVSLGWVHGDSDYDGGGSHEIDQVTLGGRINFGTASLFERNRSGASMVGLNNAVRDSILMW